MNKSYQWGVLTLKEVEGFLAVVEAGSFQGAARRLNATQPALSKRISELESKLGVRLFERSTRYCHVTARGRALVPYAQKVLAEVSAIQRTIGRQSALLGHLRLGVVETIAFTKLPELLKKLSTALGQVTVDVEVGSSKALEQKVCRGELDLACVVAPVLQQDLAAEPFCDAEMSWIAQGQRWTEKPLTIESLARQPLLMQSGSRHLPVIEGWFRSAGVRATKVIVCNSLSVAVKMTAAGLGLSLVPIECAQDELEAGVISVVPLEVQLPKNSFVMIYRTGEVAPALDALLEVMRELAAKYSGTPQELKQLSREAPRV
jgi:DNA-binding transcriptional LysR family regulator